jgi:hypothetical protein
MTTTEPESEPTRVAHLALGGGQLAVVYIRGGRVEVPIYPPGSDGPVDEHGEIQPDAVLEMSPQEAAVLASMLDRAAVRADDDGRVGEDEAVTGGLLDTALAAAAEIDRAFNHILPGELQELSDRLAQAANAWKAFLDSELAQWRPLRLVKTEERDDPDHPEHQEPNGATRMSLS